jgi:thioredoxin 1
MGEIIHLKPGDNFKAILQKSELPVIVDFHAEWCGPCKKLGPILEEKAKTFPNTFQLLTVDVDDFPDLAEEENVGGIPYVKLFIKGKFISDFVGCDVGSLEKMLESLKK